MCLSHVSRRKRYHHCIETIIKFYFADSWWNCFKFAHKNVYITRRTFSSYCSTRYLCLNCNIRFKNVFESKLCHFQKFFSDNRFIFPSIESVLESLQLHNMRNARMWSNYIWSTRIASFRMLFILFILHIKSPEWLI